MKLLTAQDAFFESKKAKDRGITKVRMGLLTIIQELAKWGQTSFQPALHNNSGDDEYRYFNLVEVDDGYGPTTPNYTFNNANQYYINPITFALGGPQNQQQRRTRTVEQTIHATVYWDINPVEPVTEGLP